MSLTQWLTRSSPTVSCLPALMATRTLVPTPSVLMTSVGSTTSAGTLTIPPNEPSTPRASVVRVDATAAPLRCLVAAATSRSTPASRYRSVMTPPRSTRRSVQRDTDVEVHQIGKRMHPFGNLGGPDFIEAFGRKSLDRERAHGRAIHHRATHIGARGITAPCDMPHES